MKEYIIYFEFFGKKMEANIKASDKKAAKDILLNKINIHKINEVEKANTKDEWFEYFKKMANDILK